MTLSNIGVREDSREYHGEINPFILLQTYFVKTQLSVESSNAGEGGKKEQRTTRSKVKGLNYSDNESIIGDLKIG